MDGYEAHRKQQLVSLLNVYDTVKPKYRYDVDADLIYLGDTEMPYGQAVRFLRHAKMGLQSGIERINAWFGEEGGE